MTNLQEKDLNALSDLLTIRDAKGRVAISIGLIVSAYFKNPCTRAAREAIAALAERYINDFGQVLTWATNMQGNRQFKLTQQRGPSPSEWLPAQPEGESWQVGYHGAGGQDEASPYQLRAYGSKLPNGMGFLHLHLPLRWLADHPGAFPSLILDICEALRPISGYAGVGLQLPMTHEGAYASEMLIPPLAKRFPGIEVDEPIGTNLSLKDGGIKGVNWLTILHDRYLPELGGLDYLRIRLPESTFPFYKYDGGLIIQAGPFPEVGDTTQNRWPRHYVTLAKVLKKIQVASHYPLVSGRPGAMDGPAMTAWIHRFDDK